MLPTIKLSSVDDANALYTRENDLSIKEFWDSLSWKDILHLQELFSPNRIFQEKEEEKENDVTVSRFEFISAISDVFGSGRFESAATLVFNAALAASTSAVAPTMSSSSSSPTLVSAFTAFKTTVTSSSSSSTSYNESNLSLHQRIATSSPTEIEDRVSWGAILRQFLQFSKDPGLETKQEQKLIFDHRPAYFPLPYIHREEFIKIRVTEHLGHFLAIGAKGQLTMLNNRFQPIRQGQIILTDLTTSSGGNLFEKSEELSEPWVTCSSSLGRRMEVVGTVAGVLHIIKDSKATGLYEIFRITELPSIPTALHSGIDGEVWWIALGDENGSLYLLKSCHSFEGFLKKANRKGVFVWNEAFSKVGVFHLKKAHGESVTDIVYHLSTDSLASCSKDKKIGLLVTRPYSSAHKYKFTIAKGVRAMSVEWNLHIIATVCGDGLVRTWNPFVVSSPLIELPPSYAHDPPLDVAVVAQRSLLIVLYIDSFLGIWSLESVNPLQTMILQIPGGQKWNPISKPLTTTPSGKILVLGLHHIALISLLDHANDESFKYSVETSSLSSFDEKEQNKMHPSAEGKEKEDLTEVMPMTNGDTSYECIMTYFDDKGKERMKKMVRQGAPFCCLKLFKIQKPSLPKDLPLPRRLAALGLSLDDSTSFLTHLGQSKKLN